MIESFVVVPFVKNSRKQPEVRWVTCGQETGFTMTTTPVYQFTHTGDEIVIWLVPTMLCLFFDTESDTVCGHSIHSHFSVCLKWQNVNMFITMAGCKDYKASNEPLSCMSVGFMVSLLSCPELKQLNTGSFDQQGRFVCLISAWICCQAESWPVSRCQFKPVLGCNKFCSASNRPDQCFISGIFLHHLSDAH